MKDMISYKYAPGDLVTIGSRMHNVPSGPYTILRRLPSDTGDVSYRVRSASEAFERIVEERRIDGSVATSKSDADAVFSVTG